MTKFEHGVEILVKHLAAIKTELDRQNVTEEGTLHWFIFLQEIKDEQNLE